MAEEPKYQVKGIPEISSQEEYDFLEPGMKFISNGKVYTKGRNQREIPTKGVRDAEWGAQEEVINMMLAGYGDEVLGALDWLSAAIVPDTLSLTGRDKGPDPTLAEAQEGRRQAQRVFREVHPWQAAGAQILGGLTPTGGAAKAGQLLIKAFPALAKIPRYLRGVVGGTVQGAVIASGEADPGERLQRAKTGAVTGAFVSSTLPIVVGIGGFVVKTIGGRVNPRKTARNIVNSAILQSNVRGAETATEQELSQLPPELQNLPVHLRRTARRLGQLGPDATIADAAPGAAVRAVGHLATRYAGLARERAEALLSSRGSDEQVRIVEALDSIISPAYGTSKQIGKSLIESATPAYDEAFDITRNDEGKIDYNAPRTVNQDLMNLPILTILATNNGRRAFKAAIEQMENEFGWDDRMGREAEEILNQLISFVKRNDRGQMISIPANSPGLSLEFLDKVKIQLQQRGEQLKKTKNRMADARVVKGQANDFITQLDALDETRGIYAAARQTAESKFKLENAYIAGLSALGPKGSVVDIRNLIQEYTEGERAMFRAGATSYLRDKILKVPERGQATRSVFGNTLIMNKLAALIDSREDLAALRKAIVQEKTYSLTQKEILSGGGAQIVISQQGAESTGMFGALLGSKLPLANPLIVAGFFRKLAQQIMGVKSNEEVVRIILTRDPAENKILINALAKLPSDPEAMRLRDLVARAMSQQIEVKRERYQVPTAGGQYRLQDFERSMLNPRYYGSQLSKALEAFRGANQRGD